MAPSDASAARPAKPGQPGRGKRPGGAAGKTGKAAASAKGGVPATVSTRTPSASPAEASRSLSARTPPEDAASPAVPSSLNMNRRPSAARSGRAGLEGRRREHNETGPAMTAGDIDADWESAYSVGDEAPGGDNPTPGQAVVEDVGRALGVEYEDGEELKAVDKIESRDRHRWELDPASSEDYPERSRGPKRKPRK